MVDFAIGTHIGMHSVPVLHVPMEIFFASVRMRVRDPFITSVIDIAILAAARGTVQPVPPLRGHVGMCPISG